MGRKIINTLLLISISIYVYGQNSNEKPHADKFFVTNGDTVWYSTIFTWKHSDVNWLRNSRTQLLALVDSNLNVLTEFKYERFCPFYGKCGAVMRNGKWGVVNKKGEEVIPFKYTMFPFSFSDTSSNKEYYVFTKKNKVGVIDSDGETIIPFKWDGIRYLEYVILEMEKDKCRYLYFMKTGKTVPIKKDMIICSDFNAYGETIVKDLNLNKYGIMDTSCTIIQPCIYNGVKEVRQHLK